jgi:hypothetical protein
LELLQERLIQDGIVSGIAPETVRLLLTPALAGGAREKTNSNLGL